MLRSFSEENANKEIIETIVPTRNDNAKILSKNQGFD